MGKGAGVSGVVQAARTASGRIAREERLGMWHRSVEPKALQVGQDLFRGQWPEPPQGARMPVMPVMV